jgi:hypothetical protein
MKTDRKNVYLLSHLTIYAVPLVFVYIVGKNVVKWLHM